MKHPLPATVVAAAITITAGCGEPDKSPNKPPHGGSVWTGHDTGYHAGSGDESPSPDQVPALV